MKINHSLVDAVYDLALDPGGFGQFIEVWEQYIQDQGLLDQQSPQLALALAQHFERAFEVMLRADESSKNAKALLPQRTVASMSVTVNGEITSYNDLAKPMVQSHSSLTEVFCCESIQSVMAALADVIQSNKSKPLLVQLESGVPCLLLIHLSRPSSEIIIDASRMSWSATHKDQLTALYGLTPRECEVAGLLFQGLSIKEIASQQHRSPETVRKQSKALLSKTGTHSQAQLMRLLASINLSSTFPNKSNWQHSYLDNKSFKLTDGRTLAYYDAGSAVIGTVVVLHGILHDPELPKIVHETLVKSGYRVIGVARAWFGDSSPPPDKQQLLSTAAKDLEQLLDALEVHKTALIGIMAGSLHAYKFCSLYPQRVSRIINLSGVVPITNDTQLQHLPRGIRAIARSARYFPKTLPALVFAGVSLLNRGNIKRLFEIGYRNSPTDLLAATEPILMRRLLKGYRFAAQHGYAAYTYEGIEIMRNMSSELERVTCPVHYINGELDGLTSIDSVVSFCNSRPNTNYIAVPGVGNLLLYTCPQTVSNGLTEILLKRPETA